MNRDQLMFCEDSLPEWALDQTAQQSLESNEADEMTFSAPLQREAPVDMSSVFEVPRNDQSAMKKLGDAFKAACEEATVQNNQKPSTLGMKMPEFVEIFNPTMKADSATATKPAAEAQKAEAPVSNIRPVEFRRIDMTRDLG
ncbi:hypothetical protein D3C87_1653980 [compost metagenome]